MKASGFIRLLLALALFAIIGLIVLSPKNQSPKPQDGSLEQTDVADSSEAPKLQSVDPSLGALETTLTLNVAQDNGGEMLDVETNLPITTVLTVLLVRPTIQGGESYTAELKRAVGADHIAHVGPFLKDGGPIPSGVYKAHVSTSLFDQPKELFGVNGARLSGRHVFSPPGLNMKTIYQEYQFTIATDGSVDRLPVEVEREETGN